MNSYFLELSDIHTWLNYSSETEPVGKVSFLKTNQLQIPITKKN